MHVNSPRGAFQVLHDFKHCIHADKIEYFWSALAADQKLQDLREHGETHASMTSLEVIQHER